MQKVSSSLTTQGFKVQDILYQDILYKIDSDNILTIIFKVSVNSKNFSFQYKGTIPANTPTTPSPSNPTTNTSSQSNQSSQQTSNLANDNSVVTIQNINYIKASPSLSSQNYISLYLKYLAASNSKYQLNNLVGIYINPHSPNTLLFRYLYLTQYYN